MSSIAENKYKKRVSILDAAFELFTSKSVTETAIDDVVKLAGVAKGTFYLYFRDKYDLLDQIVMHRTSEIFVDAYKKLRTANEQDTLGVPQQFIFIADEIIGYLRRNKKIAALIDKRMFLCFSDENYIENSVLKEVRDYFTQLITQLKYSTTEAQKRLLIITDMVSSVVFNSILSEKPFPIDEIIPTVHEFLNILLSEVKSVD